MARGLHITLIFFYLIVVMLIVVVPVMGYQKLFTTWDDSFFFVRYAEHYFNGEGIVWNIGDAPTYGLTSQLYFVWTVILYALTNRNAILTLQFSSHVWGAITMLLVVLTVSRATISQNVKIYASGFAAITMLLSPQFYFHFSTGMDTTLSTAFVALLLMVYLRTERTGASKWAILSGILGAIGYLIRPDLLLFAFLLPIGLLAQQSGKKNWVLTGLALGTTVIAVGLLLVLLRQYYGTPLPLPFFAKMTNVSAYDSTFRQIYRLVGGKEFAAFFSQNALLFASLALGLPVFAQLTTVLRAGLVAVVAFCSYYLFFVLQVMHDQARFYYPIYPVLVVTASIQLGMYLESRQEGAYGQQQAVQMRKMLGEPVARILMVLLIAQLYLTALSHVQLFRRIWGDGDGATVTNVSQTALWNHYRANWVNYWYRLDLVTALPKNCVIAATEVGLPGILNPDKRIIDMAGLNNREFVHKQFSPDLLLNEIQPDIIYLPHPDYRTWVESIEQHPAFLANYWYLSSSRTGALLGVALRQNSPCSDVFFSTLHKSESE